MDHPVVPPGVAGGQRQRLLYLAVCDPDLPVTGVTVRMGAFVKYLSRFYEITLVHMAGSGHGVDPELEARFRDRETQGAVAHRVRVPFSQPGIFCLAPPCTELPINFCTRAGLTICWRIMG